MSFGEQDILINSTIVGKVRVLGADALPAIYPGIGISLAVALRVPQPELRSPQEFVGIQLRDISGELRLSPGGDALGSVHWNGPRRPVPANGTEYPLSLAVALSPWLVQRIETWRKGVPPQFWLQLWPTVAPTANDGWLDADCRSFAVDIPRERWLEILQKWGFSKYSVIEVPHSSLERFEAAITSVSDAKAKLDRGEYDAAIAACRPAIEAMFRALEAEGAKPTLAEYLSPPVPEDRATDYAKILTALKAITNRPHHTSSAAHQYWRAEAVFVVQTAQHFLALAGDLTTRRAEGH